MKIKRVVPNLHAENPDRSLEVLGLLGFEKVMDHGWIVTMAAGGEHSPQVSVMTEDATAPVSPDVSIEVDDVEGAYALMKDNDVEIVHPLTYEEWGVHRFFVRDANGRVINILGHR
ncbi:VOC family protein [Salininema proteolyticum]|uniref:VOC family protein n=1 Tax=Salininema proteolyticum TaxID=1607685 RepID=A0ABV8TXD2_9ACTN